MFRTPILIALCLGLFAPIVSDAADAPDFAPQPIPRVQAIPLPLDQVSFQRDGIELARHYGLASQRRPFLYPLNGPSGRSLTRMGHPHDPRGHSHHNSLWVSHTDVGGTDFWSDNGQGRIVQQAVLALEDGDAEAGMRTLNHWIAGENQTLLHEQRQVKVVDLVDGEWLLVLDIQLRPATDPVTLGKTPFGLVGVRMAKSIGVHDGGGRIRNSEGGVNEAGVFWKNARWVDYSGAIAANTVEGITLLDHPANPNHPSMFHVRDDGWMGASLTHGDTLTIATGDTLRLRYGLYIHRDLKPAEAIEERWKAFSESELPELFEAK